MGTCCEAHLLTKVNEYANVAKDKAVNVQLMENPKCDYCNAKARYIVSYLSA